MMNLFSSFDSYYFLFHFFYVFIFLFLFCHYWMNNLWYLIFSKTFQYLGSYLGTLQSDWFKFLDTFLVSVLFYIFCLNILSILPYNFCLTSQSSVVLGLSLIMWGSWVSMSVSCSINSILCHFVPESSPLVLSVFLFIIEFISNLIRPVTLSIRLVANILAGHLLMSLLSGLILNKVWMIVLFFILNMFEFGVSLIQSYIFLTMSKLYHA